MFSKFLRPCLLAAPLRLALHPLVPKRCMSSLIPPDQYDVPFPRRLQLTYAMVKYWEIIPLVTTTAIAISIIILFIFYALVNKVDVVYSTHNYNTIERTMDLRNPTIHKIIIINQRYLPWPEMQSVLDKMCAAEKRALAALSNCPHA